MTPHGTGRVRQHPAGHMGNHPNPNLVMGGMMNAGQSFAADAAAERRIAADFARRHPDPVRRSTDTLAFEATWEAFQSTPDADLARMDADDVRFLAMNIRYDAETYDLHGYGA